MGLAPSEWALFIAGETNAASPLWSDSFQFCGSKGSVLAARQIKMSSSCFAIKRMAGLERRKQWAFFYSVLKVLKASHELEALVSLHGVGYVTASICARLTVEPLLNEPPQTQQQIFAESAGLTSLLESPSQIPLLPATTKRLATAFMAEANNNCLLFDFMLLDVLIVYCLNSPAILKRRRHVLICAPVQAFG